DQPRHRANSRPLSAHGRQAPRADLLETRRREPHRSGCDRGERQASKILTRHSHMSIAMRELAATAVRSQCGNDDPAVKDNNDCGYDPTGNMPHSGILDPIVKGESSRTLAAKGGKRHLERPCAQQDQEYPDIVASQP